MSSTIPGSVVPTVKDRDTIRSQRRRTPGQTHDLILACPWPKTDLNLGTLLRTVDAVNGCMAIPDTATARAALRKGDRVGVHNVCIHGILGDPIEWLSIREEIIVAVELADGAIPLKDLPALELPHIVLVGNETTGIPQAALDLVDVVVEIPMVGVGSSLNVAVAGSLVLYKLRGWV